jgi:hypothetical protein
MINEIKTIDDVKAFFRQLLDEDLNFHPDTPFEDYIHGETRKPTYSIAEAAIRNKLMEQSFDVCEEVNIDIYEIANKIFPPFPWQV